MSYDLLLYHTAREARRPRENRDHAYKRTD